MANPKLKDRVQSPFTPRRQRKAEVVVQVCQRERLLMGLKEGLFEAGHYDYVFVTRLHRVTTALGDLMTI